MIKIFIGCRRQGTAGAGGGPVRARKSTSRCACLGAPSRASGGGEAGGDIVDQRKEDGARGGEAVALGAAPAGAAPELGGARRIIEQPAERRAQRRRGVRRPEPRRAL